MRGDRFTRPTRGSTTVILAVLVVMSGCQGLVGSTPNQTTVAPKPTDTADPHSTVSPGESTGTQTSGPDISPRRVAELTRFSERVDFATPANIEWEFLGPETVRYRTTPDFDIRDEYGPEAEPLPEAIAREMGKASEIAPQTAVIEVVSDDGEFLGEFNVTESMARGLVNYSLEPMEFVNKTYRTGNFTDAYSTERGASVKTLFIDKIELRKAYLNKTREWLSANVSGSADRLVDSGLYNESFEIPKQNIAIKSNSTIYFTIRNNPGETSPNLIELHRIWPLIYGSKYYDRRSLDLVLQIRVYNRSGTDFRYSLNYISPFVEAYTDGDMSEGEYDLYIIKYSIHNPDYLPGVSVNITNLKI